MTNNCTHNEIIQNEKEVQDLIVYCVDKGCNIHWVKNDLEYEEYYSGDLRKRFLISVCIMFFIGCFDTLFEIQLCRCFIMIDDF